MTNSNNIDQNKFSNYLKDVPVPDEKPRISIELKSNIEKLAGEEIPNLSNLFENMTEINLFKRIIILIDRPIDESSFAFNCF